MAASFFDYGTYDFFRVPVDYRDYIDRVVTVCKIRNYLFSKRNRAKTGQRKTGCPPGTPRFSFMNNHLAVSYSSASLVENLLGSVLSNGCYGIQILLTGEVCRHLFDEDEIDRSI